jgi:hypothetical protein
MVRLILVAFGLLVLVGCGGGNSAPTATINSAVSTSANTAGGSDSTATTADVSGTLPAGSDPALLGVWKEVSDTAGNPLETCQFNADGSVSCSAGTGQDQIGTWVQVDASHIRFGYNGASAVLEYHINGKTLTFNFANPPSTQVYEKE